MNAAPFALSPSVASSRAPAPATLPRQIAPLFLSLSYSWPSSPLSHRASLPGFSLLRSPATFSVGPSCAPMRTSPSPSPRPSLVAALFGTPPSSLRVLSSSASHSYSCSGNSLPPARRRTLLHFLRAFSPPRATATPATRFSLLSAPPPSRFLLSFSSVPPPPRLLSLFLRLPLAAVAHTQRQPPSPAGFTVVSSNNSRTYRAPPRGFFICGEEALAGVGE